MTQSREMIEELYEAYTKTAANISSYYEGNERSTKLKELRDIVENNCIQEKKIKSANDIRNQIYGLYKDDDDDDDVMPNVESVVQEYVKDLAKINTDVSKDTKFVEFNRQIEALLEEDQEENDNEDAEVQLTGGYINVIDPITKKRIQDPVKNTICGHTYDRESITQLLKCKKKTRCPVIGCGSTEFVSLSHLRTDIVTKTYLEKNSQ